MKVILILVDGMRPDALLQANGAEALLAAGASTMEAQTVFPSVTLPCHISLFLSVDPERHGTTTNIYAPQVRPIQGLFEVLRRHKKTCAMFYAWEELRDVSRPGSMTYSRFISGARVGYTQANGLLTSEALALLQKEAPDFTFLYLGYPDAAGHDHGWMSPEYMEAVQNSIDNIHRVLSALPEEYVMLVCADHGGHNRTHGSDLPEDMTIPVIAIGAPFAPSSKLENVNIKDLAPTAAKLLGVPTEEEWEGKSLV